jgi:hypothetical protein
LLELDEDIGVVDETREESGDAAGGLLRDRERGEFGPNQWLEGSRIEDGDGSQQEVEMSDDLFRGIPNEAVGQQAIH